MGFLFGAVFTPVFNVYAEESPVEVEDNMVLEEGPNEVVSDSLSEETPVSEAIATLDGVEYDGLDAVFATIDADTSGAQHTVVILKDLEGVGGYSIKGGKDVVIDFNGHSVTMGTTLVGSTGTVSQNWQLLKGSKYVMKNGKLIASGNSAMLIQNYSDLTITDLEIDAKNASYAISNNNGSVLINGSTSIKVANGKRAFDACWWPYSSNGKEAYPDGAQVVVDTTGTIDGIVELDYFGKHNDDEPILTTLTIKNGTFMKGFNIEAGLEDQLVIEGGKFAEEPDDEMIVPEMEAEQGEDEIWELLPKQIEAASVVGEGIDVELKNEIIMDRKAEVGFGVLTDEEKADILGLDDGMVLVFDVEIQDRNGDKIEIGEGNEATVRYNVSDSEYEKLAQYDKVVVYYIEDGGVKEIIDAELKADETSNNKYVEFRTSHFSTYAVGGVNNAVQNEEAEDTETADGSVVGVADTGMFTAAEGNVGGAKRKSEILMMLLASTMIAAGSKMVSVGITRKRQ